MPSSLRVLIIEDSVDDTFFIVRELQRGGYNVSFERVETHGAMKAALESHPWDLIISDYAMPQFGGAAALALYRETGMDIPFIIVSGALGEDRAVQMLKEGAHDYVMKDNLSRLVPAVRHELQAAQERRIRRQSQAASAYLASLVQSCDDAIVGKNLEGIVLSWNAGAEKLYGYSAVEMIGRPISVLLSPFRPDELTEIMTLVRRGEHVHGFETVRLRKDGTPVEVSLTISPIKDSNDRIIGASTVARDITQKRREENERLALIQELTSALSHAK